VPDAVPSALRTEYPPVELLSFYLFEPPSSIYGVNGMAQRVRSVNDKRREHSRHSDCYRYLSIPSEHQVITSSCPFVPYCALYSQVVKVAQRTLHIK